MDKIKLNADASNWSEVTNVSNYGRTFIAPNGKEFILQCKAHCRRNIGICERAKLQYN